MCLIQDTKLFLSSEICVHLSLTQAKLLPVVYSEDHCSEQHSHLSKVQLLQSTER